MKKDSTTFIRATLKNSLDNLSQSGITINTLSRVKANVSDNAVCYDTGNIEDEILLLVTINNKNNTLGDEAILSHKDILVRDAKMVALCLAYLPVYGNRSAEERIYADEWRRLEREITIQELSKMQTTHNVQ